MSARRCFDCGGSCLEGATFTRRKSKLQRIRCDDCKSFPLAVSAERVAARRAEIAALRAAGRYRPAKPFHTAPLFAWAASIGEGI